MGTLLGKKNIKVKEEGLSLEDISEGSVLIFPNGREELIKKVDVLACRLFTERITFTRDYKITNKVGYHLNAGFGEPNILLPNNKGDVYDYIKRAI